MKAKISLILGILLLAGAGLVSASQYQSYDCWDSGAYDCTYPNHHYYAHNKNAKSYPNYVYNVRNYNLPSYSGDYKNPYTYTNLGSKYNIQVIQNNPSPVYLGGYNEGSYYRPDYSHSYKPTYPNSYYRPSYHDVPRSNRHSTDYSYQDHYVTTGKTTYSYKSSVPHYLGRSKEGYSETSYYIDNHYPFNSYQTTKGYRSNSNRYDSDTHEYLKVRQLSYPETYVYRYSYR